MNEDDVTEFSHNQLVIIKQFPNSHFVCFTNITNINIMDFFNQLNICVKSRVVLSNPATHPSTDNLKMRYVSTLCRLGQTPRHIHIFGISTTSVSILE